MRGRWASAAIGAGIARHRAEGRAEQEIQAANQASQTGNGKNEGELST